MHEVPGITPRVADFGRRVAEAGMTAVLPSLFGTPGKPPSMPAIVRTMAEGCVSREFTTWATGRTSPAIVWLRALARERARAVRRAGRRRRRDVLHAAGSRWP